MKTNAVRALDRLGVPYEIREYAVDPEDLGAEKVAEGIGMPIHQVFKTLVVRGERRGVLLAVLAGDDELDFKALARAAGDRRVEMVPLKDVQPLTGYVRGGVTALACKKAYPVIADDANPRVRQDRGFGGRPRGAVGAPPDDYLRATSATVAPSPRRRTTRRSE